MPAGAGSLPYAMAGDDKGKVWLAETGVPAASGSKKHVRRHRAAA